jgi:hypothetical protein
MSLSFCQQRQSSGSSLPDLSYVAITSEIEFVSEGEKMSGYFAECITFYEERNIGACQAHGHFEK